MRAVRKKVVVPVCENARSAYSAGANDPKDSADSREVN
jgi:hypothetical protein